MSSARAQHTQAAAGWATSRTRRRGVGTKSWRGRQKSDEDLSSPLSAQILLKPARLDPGPWRRIDPKPRPTTVGSTVAKIPPCPATCAFGFVAREARHTLTLRRVRPILVVFTHSSAWGCFPNPFGFCHINRDTGRLFQSLMRFSFMRRVLTARNCGAPQGTT